MNTTAATGESSFEPQNFLEHGWVWCLSHMSPWVFASVGSLLVHEITYFVAFLPYFVADFIPSLHKYKLQPNKVNEKSQLWNCFKRLMFLHFVVELPMMIMSHPILDFLGMSMELPLPSLYSIVTTCLFSFFIEDFYFYVVHRLLHWGWFYKAIHKVHHEHTSPFGMVGEYAHPVETVVLGFGTLLGPYLFARHVVALWIWVTVRVFQVVEVHSGYDFPWSLNRWIPGWGGAKFHDFHHMTFVGNYASTFTWWDRIFGTDAKYRDYQARLAKGDKVKMNIVDPAAAPEEAPAAANGNHDGARRSPRLARRFVAK
jgi:sterol desaturase/sphingolipid hydroxylase (fatty acid hydroxylase superfamily)